MDFNYEIINEDFNYEITNEKFENDKIWVIIIKFSTLSTSKIMMEFLEYA